MDKFAHLLKYKPCFWDFTTAVLVLVFALSMPSPQQAMARNQACDSLTVSYDKINSAQFPTIVSDITIYNADSTSVGGLKEADFSVFENGVRQLPITVEEFGSDSGGVTIALLMDRSNSMSAALPAVKRTAIEFVNLMLPDDRMAIATFGKDARLEQDFTDDKSALTGAINAISLEPYTALYDGVLYGLELMKDVPGHKAIVLLTDGRDRDSRAELEEIIAEAGLADIPIFGIGLGLKPDWGEPEMQQIVAASGGRYYRSPTVHDLAEIYQTIFFQLHRYWYRISYNSSHCAMDGTLRNVRIEARTSGESCSAESSYTAPDHQVELALTSSDALIPGEPFDVLLEIPPSSKPLLQMTSLQVMLRYDPALLSVKTPHADNILSGDLAGNPADFELNFNIDAANGEILIDLKTASGAPVFSGNGELLKICFLANTTIPDSTPVQLTLENLDARDGPDCQIAMQTENLSVLSDGLLVWPGDTDFNGRVDLADVLVLGVYWGTSGPPRPGDEDQLAWMPHLAKKFARYEATHADADGDGTIIERDIVPIGLNWGKTQADFQPSAPQAKTAAQLPAGVMSKQLVHLGEGRYELWLEFENQNRAPLQGLTLKMDVPKNATVEAVQGGSLWPAQPLLVHKAAAGLSVGLMLTASQPAPTQSGRVLGIRLQSPVALAASDLVLREIGLVAQDGRIAEIAQLATGQGGSGTPQQFSLQPAFPNPFNPATTLHYDLPHPAEVQVRIYDRTGRLVRHWHTQKQSGGRHLLRWSGTDQSGRFVGSGVYFVEVIARSDGEQFVARQKLTLLK